MIVNIRKIICSLILFILIFYFGGCMTPKKDSEELNHKKNQEENQEKHFPSKAIKIVVPYSAGGGTDSVARALAHSAKKYFEEPIVIVNITGHGGAVGIASGANAEPDGYTVTMIPSEIVTLNNFGLTPFTYRDFKPIVQLNEDPGALIVKAKAPWNNVEDFIKYAKQNPGKVRVGNSGAGSIWHLSSANIENKTGAKFKHVFFDGSAPAAVTLLGGEIDAIMSSPPEVLRHVKNNQLKILGVLSAQRINSLPNVPTFKEQGYDSVIYTWRGLGVPKDTPEDIVKILEEGFTKAAKDSDFIAIMNKLELGYKVVGSKKFLRRIENNNELFKDLIEGLDIKK